MRLALKGTFTQFIIKKYHALVPTNSIFCKRIANNIDNHDGPGSIGHHSHHLPARTPSGRYLVPVGVRCNLEEKTTHSIQPRSSHDIRHKLLLADGHDMHPITHLLITYTLYHATRDFYTLVNGPAFGCRGHFIY